VRNVSDGWLSDVAVTQIAPFGAHLIILGPQLRKMVGPLQKLSNRIVVEPRDVASEYGVLHRAIRRSERLEAILLLHLFRYLQASKTFDLPLRRAGPKGVAITNAPQQQGQAPAEASASRPGVDGHAGEAEMANVMASRPELVHPDRAGTESGKDLNRLDLPSNVYTGIWWYAKFPNHYQGDAADATAARGQALTKIVVVRSSLGNAR